MKCSECHHEHQGASLAYICVGCPCPERPGAPVEGAAKTIEQRIPKWFWEVSDRIYDFPIRGEHWLTNGHVLLRLDAPGVRVVPFKGVAGSAMSAEKMIDAASSHTTMSFPFIASDRDGSNIGDYLVEAEGARFSLVYIAMVERLYPGCTWRAVGHMQPAQAVLDGGDVCALVMCTGTADELHQQLRGAKRPVESAS